MAFAYPPAVVTESVIQGAAPVNKQQRVIFLSTGQSSLTAGSSPTLITSLTQATSAPVSATNDLLSFAIGFFGMGSGASFYVTELGSSATQAQINTFIQNNSGYYYIFVLPSVFTQNQNGSFAASQTLANQTACSYVMYPWSAYYLSDFTSISPPPGKGAIVCMASAINPANESEQNIFAGAMAYLYASLSPSAVTRVTPFNYSYLPGVLPTYQPNDLTDIQTAGAANVNFSTTAQFAGQGNVILLGGVTNDGNPISFWYGADYAYLNMVQALNLAIVQGANDQTNPLYYNQAGINRLLAAATASLQNAVSVGAIQSPFTINAVDFVDYITANPNAYQNGTYAGLSATVVPTRGFEQITFALTIDFTGQTLVTALTA